MVNPEELERLVENVPPEVKVPVTPEEQAQEESDVEPTCDLSSEMLAAAALAELVEENLKAAASGQGSAAREIPAWFFRAWENL